MLTSLTVTRHFAMQDKGLMVAWFLEPYEPNMVGASSAREAVSRRLSETQSLPSYFYPSLLDDQSLSICVSLNESTWIPWRSVLRLASVLTI